MVTSVEDKQMDSRGRWVESGAAANADQEYSQGSGIWTHGRHSGLHFGDLLSAVATIH